MVYYQGRESEGDDAYDRYRNTEPEPSAQPSRDTTYDRSARQPSTGAQAGLWDPDEVEDWDDKRELEAKRHWVANKGGVQDDFGSYQEWKDYQLTSETRERLGLDDPMVFERAMELSNLSKGTAGIQPWEEDFRRDLQEAQRNLYGQAQRTQNRAATMRAMQSGFAQQQQRVDDWIEDARKAEQEAAGKTLETFLINARQAGKAAALAEQGLLQQYQQGQEQRNSQMVASVIGGLATLGAGALMMGNPVVAGGFVAGGLAVGAASLID